MPLRTPRSDLTSEFVRSIFIYNSETGDLYRRPIPVRPGHEHRDRMWNTKYATPRKKKPKRYSHVKIDGVVYRTHRICWLHYYCRWPNNLIDHVNGDFSDNRIYNLREATQSENIWNTNKKAGASGLKGIRYIAKDQKWQARIGVYGVSKHLGMFDNPEAAHEAYCKAARELHGEFVRIN